MNLEASKSQINSAVRLNGPVGWPRADGVWPDPALSQNPQTLDSPPGLIAVKAGRDLFQPESAQESRNGCQQYDSNKLPSLSERPFSWKDSRPLPSGVRRMPDDSPARQQASRVLNAMPWASEETLTACLRREIFILIAA